MGNPSLPFIMNCRSAFAVAIFLISVQVSMEDWRGLHMPSYVPRAGKYVMSCWKRYELAIQDNFHLVETATGLLREMEICIGYRPFELPGHCMSCHWWENKF